MNKAKFKIALLVCFTALTSCATIKNTTQDKIEQAPYTFGTQVGTVTSASLEEISGLAPSGIYNDCFWVNNDSGDKPNIYLVNLDGNLIATLNIPSIENRDWEAVAMGDGYIYIGEIGDNNAVYSDKKIHRIAEPATINTSVKNQKITIDQVETMRFNFADGQRDSESMMYDPQSKQIILLSKREENVRVYPTKFCATQGDDITLLKKAATLNLTQATSADISLDGSKILVKNYLSIYLWHRAVNQSIAEALAEQPTILNYEPEPQGEAIAWSTYEDCFYTVSEKNGTTHPIIYRYSATNEEK